ncbi:MAG: hypothetical protein ICV63_01215 [Coleofasciculus sp. Co-bin14]|nr:hypothetical protein [Coleofasciculus sp. Co-bin14]
MVHGFHAAHKPKAIKRYFLPQSTMNGGFHPHSQGAKALPPPLVDSSSISTGTDGKLLLTYASQP